MHCNIEESLASWREEKKNVIEKLVLLNFSTFFLLLRLMNSILCTKTKQKTYLRTYSQLRSEVYVLVLALQLEQLKKVRRKTERPKRRSLAGLWKNVKNLNSYFLHTRKIHWIATDSAPSSDQAGVKCEVAEQRRRKRALKFKQKKAFSRGFFCESIEQCLNINKPHNTQHIHFISIPISIQMKKQKNRVNSLVRLEWWLVEERENWRV